jgi:hypothetical protein
VLRDHVHSIGVLGDSLRLHRPAEGMHPAVLGCADIVAFLNRLKHRESTGLISRYRRRKIAQHAALMLRECRAMGLARPDRPMAGLDPEFAFRHNDLPPVPKDDGPGRALPDSVLAAGRGPVRHLHRAVERASRRRGLPVSVPVPGLRALPLRPLLPTSLAPSRCQSTNYGRGCRTCHPMPMWSPTAADRTASTQTRPSGCCAAAATARRASRTDTQNGPARSFPWKTIAVKNFRLRTERR